MIRIVININNYYQFRKQKIMYWNQLGLTCSVVNIRSKNIKIKSFKIIIKREIKLEMKNIVMI